MPAPLYGTQNQKKKPSWGYQIATEDTFVRFRVQGSRIETATGRWSLLVVLPISGSSEARIPSSFECPPEAFRSLHAIFSHPVPDVVSPAAPSSPGVEHIVLLRSA